MIATAARAGMVSAAVILSPGCDQAQDKEAADPGAALRQASFRSFSAANRLRQCGAERADAAAEFQRFETLKDFARRRGPRASAELWRGENGWNAVARQTSTRPCSGEGDFRAAVTSFRGSLDALYESIMSFEE